MNQDQGPVPVWGLQAVFGLMVVGGLACLIVSQIQIHDGCVGRLETDVCPGTSKALTFEGIVVTVFALCAIAVGKSAWAGFGSDDGMRDCAYYGKHLIPIFATAAAIASLLLFIDELVVQKGDKDNSAAGCSAANAVLIVGGVLIY